MVSAGIRVRRSTRRDWPVLRELMGPGGVGGGCWCQWGIVPRGGKTWRACQGERNRRAFEAEIESGAVHGSLAFSGRECVGWCRYGPWEDFPRLANSPSLNQDPPPGTWSIVCFYVPSRWRGHGVAAALLDHALSVIGKRKGVRCIEAYPVPPRTFAGGKVPAAFAWTGVEPMFRERGFEASGKTGVKRQVWRLQPSSG